MYGINVRLEPIYGNFAAVKIVWTVQDLQTQKIDHASAMISVDEMMVEGLIPRILDEVTDKLKSYLIENRDAIVLKMGSVNERSD